MSVQAPVVAMATYMAMKAALDEAVAEIDEKNKQLAAAQERAHEDLEALKNAALTIRRLTSGSPAPEQGWAAVMSEGKPPSKPSVHPAFGPPKPKPQVADRKPEEERMVKATLPLSSEEKLDYSSADPHKWAFLTKSFSGGFSYCTLGTKEVVTGDIKKGIRNFKANPAKYVAITYQTSMLDWPTNQQKYTRISRKGTKGYHPTGCSADGWMTALIAEYQRLPPDLRLGRVADDFTDRANFSGYRLHHSENPPLCPGRGQGVADIPSLKIIGDIDPSDIAQGAVGDCWLLSAISSLAEFDGAIRRLFKHTRGVESMPRDGPNQYTVTLYDLKTWRPVDVTVDERLCAKAEGGKSFPSMLGGLRLTAVLPRVCPSLCGMLTRCCDLCC